MAAIFKNCHKCTPCGNNDYSSFEVLMFKIDSSASVMCLIVYRPSRLEATFLTEFSEFLSSIAVNNDKILIVGAFNFHVDLSANSCAAEFLCIIDSLNFAQLVSGPTHRRGHTLDLVFTHGLTVPSLVIDDLGISDHLCIRFSTTFHTVLKPQLPASYSRSLKPSTAGNFMDASIASSLSRDPEVSLSALSAEELLFCFSSTCQTILDNVSPLNIRRYKPKTQPWLNSTTQSLRQLCRRAERKWKKDMLQVS